MSLLPGSSRAPRSHAKPDPNVIALEYQGGHPQACRIILEAVIKRYRESLEDTYELFSGETLGLIERATGVLGRQLTEKEAEYGRFRWLWVGRA